MISKLIANFSRKNIFGYKFVAFSSLAIAVFGFLVWGHHMFVSGQSVYASMIFSFLSFAVAIPSAVKFLIGPPRSTKGSISYDTPMLYGLGFIGLFLIGGMTGLFLASIAVDVHVTDTYFVVAHFHYVMVGGTLMGYLGGLHYWWPKISGRMYPEGWEDSQRSYISKWVSILRSYRSLSRAIWGCLADITRIHPSSKCSMFCPLRAQLFSVSARSFQ